MVPTPLHYFYIVSTFTYSNSMLKIIRDDIRCLSRSAVWHQCAALLLLLHIHCHNAKLFFWGACCLLEYRRGQILYFLSRWKQSGFILADPFIGFNSSRYWYQDNNNNDINFSILGRLILIHWRKKNKQEANREERERFQLVNPKPEARPNREAASITRLFCVFSLEIQLQKAQLYL